MFENLEMVGVFSSLLGIIGTVFIGLGSFYFMMVHAQELPLALIEIMGWILTVALIVLPLPSGLHGFGFLSGFSTGIKILFSQLGLFLLPLGMCGTMKLHFADSGQTTAAIIVISAVTAVLSGASAILLHSEVIGFYAIVALFSALQFYVGTLPSGFIVGFSEESSLIRCMWVSGLLISVMVWVHLNDRELEPWFLPFRKGIMVWGGLVHFTAGLIISSRHYWNHTGNYVWANVVTLGSLLVGLAASSAVPNLSNTGLRSIINVFMTMYFLVKLSDIPWRTDNFAALITVLGLLMWGVSMIMRSDRGFGSDLSSITN